VAAAALFFRSSFFTVAVPLSVNAIEAVRPTTTIRQVSGGDRHLNFHDYRVNSDLHPVSVRMASSRLSVTHAASSLMAETVVSRRP